MLFCKYCGKTLPDDVDICPHCHRSQSGADYASAVYEPEDDAVPYEEAEFELEEAEYEPEEPESPTADAGPEPDHVIVTHRPPVQEPPKDPEPVRYTAEPRQQSASQPKLKASGLSIAAFVCSLTVFLSGLGAILAIVDLVKGKSEPRKKGLSIAALIISGVVMVIAFIGNNFIKPDMLAPKEETLNEIAAAGAQANAKSTAKAGTKATAKTTAKAAAKPTAKATKKASSFPRPAMPTAIRGKLLFSPADEFDFVAVIDDSLRWEYRITEDGFEFTRELEREPTAQLLLTSHSVDDLSAEERSPDGLIASIIKNFRVKNVYTPHAVKINGGYTGQYAQYTVADSGQSLKLVSWLAGDRIYLVFLVEQEAKEDAYDLFRSIPNTFQLAPEFDTSAAPTAKQTEALSIARRYIGDQSYGLSYRFLIYSLMEGHGIAPGDAVYAADHCGADWYQEAAAKAKNDTKWASYTGAISDLQTMWLFPEDQARYGANQLTENDWKEHALNLCQLLFDSDTGSGWSSSSVLSALEHDGFTQAQIAYAKAHWTVDFREQAVKYAQYTLKANKDDNWIRQRINLVGYLQSSGHFTLEEATYAADKLGIK